MSYGPLARARLDPLVAALMDALGWDWPGEAGVPSADECAADIAEALRRDFDITPRSASSEETR